jgi:hypothetical protein
MILSRLLFRAHGLLARLSSLSSGVQWKKLEEKLFAEPLYKVILRRRRARGV